MSDIVEEMGGYMGDGSEFTQPTQTRTHPMSSTKDPKSEPTTAEALRQAAKEANQDQRRTAGLPTPQATKSEPVMKFGKFEELKPTPLDAGYYMGTEEELDTPQATQVWNGDNPPGVTTAVSLANAPQATKPELVSVSPKEFGEAFFKRHDETTKPVDDLYLRAKFIVDKIQLFHGGSAGEDIDNTDTPATPEILALISNQVASAVKEARIDEAHKAWVLIGNSPKSQAGKELLRLQHERIATLNGVTK